MPQKDKNKDKMEDRYTRTKMLIGDKIDALKAAKVLVCGVGGVGGYVVEALANSSLGWILARMFRLPQKSSFITVTLPSTTRPNRSMVSPAWRRYSFR